MANYKAIVFPGQGSQFVGMGADLAEVYATVKETVSIASEVLAYDLWRIIQENPEDKLSQTTYTQPALLAISYATWQILQSQANINPAYLAGHSLGEYTALVCAGALSFQDAIKLVAARGQYMQEAVAKGIGAMAAIVGLPDAVVIDSCKECSQGPQDLVTPANFNSIGQVVVAGHATAVLRLIERAKEHGAKLAKKIPVSVPSHCALMQPAATRLAEMLKDISIQPTQIPVINNADVTLYDDAESIRAGLTKQLSHPVRWVETIQLLQAKGISEVIECGPGKVLSGLNKRIDKSLTCYTTSDVAQLQSLLNVENRSP